MNKYHFHSTKKNIDFFFLFFEVYLSWYSFQYKLFNLCIYDPQSCLVLYVFIISKAA